MCSEKWIHRENGVDEISAAGEMRRVPAGWQRSGLTLREFGEQGGIPVSTLTWWRRVFQDAGAEELNGTAEENAAAQAQHLNRSRLRTSYWLLPADSYLTRRLFGNMP